MPVLTPEERAEFDISQFVSVGYVYLSQPDVVFEAPLVGGFFTAGAVVALSYGTPTVGAYTDIQPEMTLELWNSDYNAYGSQRIRQAATSSAIFVGRSAQGNLTGELTIADGATIKVFKERRAWSKIPFISPNGTQYKDTLAYPGDNASQPPVANAGPDALIVVNNWETEATISLDALGDVPSFAVRNGATLSAYLWDLDDGSVDTGTLTSSSLTATFPIGERYVSLRVTDSNGITHTAYKYVVVATKAMCIPVRIAEEVIRPSGVSWRFTVNLEDLPSGVREGTKVLYTQHDDYSLSQVAVRFSGWLGPENFKLKSAEKQQKEITITCYDVAERLRQIHGFPLTVEIASGTSGWYRMPNANIDRLTHHYLQWHTNVLALADFSWSGLGGTYPLPRFTTDGATIWEQGDRLARAIAYTLTCNSKGQIKVKGDPMVLPTAAQAAEYSLPTQRTSTVVTTLTEDDYGEHEFNAAIPPGTHWLRGSAVVASTNVNNITTVKAAAPSKTPGQGRSTQEETEQLVRGQAEFNARLANRYAARVNPRMGQLTLNMVKSRHILEPADMEWIKVILPADERAKYPDLSADGDKYLVSEIVNRYDLEKLRKNSTWVCEREFEGVVNNDMTVIDPPPPTQPDNPDTEYSDWDTDYVPTEPTVTIIEVIYGLPPTLAEGQGMVLFLSDGTIAVTEDFDTPSYEGGPTWTVYDHSAELGENVLQWCRQSGQVPVTGWLLTTDKIFKIALAQNATPIIAEEHDFGYASVYRNIDQDALFAPGLFAVVASVNDDTVMETRTIDGGATWGAETPYGTVVPDGVLYDFTEGDEDWSALTSSDSDVAGAATPASGTAGSLTANGWVTSDYTQANASVVRAIYVHIDLAEPIVVADGQVLTATFDYSQGLHSSLFEAWRLQTKDSGGTWTIRSSTTAGSASNGTDEQMFWVASGDTEIHGISVWIRTDHNGGFGEGWSPSGSALLKRVAIGTIGNSATPGVHITTEDAGLVYAGLGIPDEEFETPLYLAEDYSFEYTQETTLIDDSGLLTGIITRVGDVETIYYGYLSVGDSSLGETYDDSNNLFRATLEDGQTDITPVLDNVRYGPDWVRSRFTIAVSSADGNVVCLVGVNQGRTTYGVFITNTALTDSPVWQALVIPDEDVDYRRCMFSSDASSLIIFGMNGAIAYSDNPLNPLALDDRMGNLNTTAEIIGIASYTP